MINEVNDWPKDAGKMPRAGGELMAYEEEA